MLLREMHVAPRRSLPGRKEALERYSGRGGGEDGKRETKINPYRVFQFSEAAIYAGLGFSFVFF